VNSYLMNKLILLSAVLLLSLSITNGQERPAVRSDLEVQKGAKGGERMAVQPPQATTTRAPTKIYYGGFLADLMKANKPARTIDTRSVGKPKTNTDNVYMDPDNKPRGFVLFAIKF